MNRFRLFSAWLISLGALTALSAQEVKLNLPDDKGAAQPAAAPAPAAQSFTEAQVLESLGWFLGRQSGLPELDLTKDQIDALAKGMVAAAAGKAAPYDPAKIGPEVQAFMEKKQQAYLTKLRSENESEAKTFFAKLKENKNVVSLPSGLCYEVIKPGTGAYPKPTDTVKVHYTGRLLNGTVFDSSVQRGKPVEFALDGVIPGWSEGLQKINTGGKIRLYVPANLAYGDNGNQSIPPGAALVFDVELLEIKGQTPAANTTEQPKQ